MSHLLFSLSLTNDCQNDSLAVIGQNCNKLKYLDISSSGTVTDQVYLILNGQNIRYTQYWLVRRSDIPDIDWSVYQVYSILIGQNIRFTQFWLVRRSGIFDINWSVYQIYSNWNKTWIKKQCIFNFEDFLFRELLGCCYVKILKF